VRSTALLATILSLPTLVGCSGQEDHAAGHDAGLHSQQGLPSLDPGEPEPPVIAPPPEPAPQPELEPAPNPTADPLAERKVALANVGTAAFEALKAGEFARLRELTPLDEGPVREACPDVARGDASELEAKFDYCHRKIDWDAVAEAQVFANKEAGERAEGCQEGIEDYGRLQLFLHMTDKTIWRVDFYGAVGTDGNVSGIDGSLSCKTVDKAEPL
jgi:hypothetical protein